MIQPDKYPASWATIQLGRVAQVIMGQSPPGSSYNTDGQGMALIAGASDLGEMFPQPAKWTTEPTQVCHTGDLIYCIRATIGNMNFADREYCLGRGVAAIRSAESVLDTHFLYYWLLTSQDDLLKRATGSTFVQLRGQDLKEHKIPLPPLPEQRRIVEILRQADDVRRLRRRSNERAQELLPALFNEMFGDPATNPKGWEFEKIGALVDVKTGGTPSRKTSEYFGGQIPWVKTTEVVGTIIYDTEEKITHQGLESSNCELFPVNTILVAMYGQGLTRGRTAKLGIPATTNQACAALLPSPKINSDFLWSYLQLSYDRLRDLGRGGNQPNLNLSIIKDFGIFLPPFPLQEEFASRLEQIQATQKKQDQSYQRFGDLFQSLLAQAFSGVLTSAWREAHQAELIPATSALEVVTKMAISPIEAEAVDVVVGQDKAVVEAAVESPSVAGLRDLILEAAAKHLRRYWTLMDLTGLPRLSNLPRNAVREAIDMLVVLGQVRQAYLRADEPDIPQGYVETYTLVRDEELIKADEIEL